MKNDYNSMYDKLCPQKSDDELLQAVLTGKADNMNIKHKKKTIIIPALIAAALCATTVGVSAANDWKLTGAMSNVMQNIFGKKNELQPADKDFTEYGFENLRGKELSDVIDCGEYKIALKGVTADKYTAFIVYDIVFDKDFDHKLKDGEEWCALLNQTDSNRTEWLSEFYRKQGNQPNPFSYSQNEFLGMDGNIAHCYTEVANSIPLQDKTLELVSHGLYRRSAKAPYIGKEIDCSNDEFSITFDFDTSASSKTIEPNSKISVDGASEGKITYLSVSPFGLMINIVWDDSEKMGKIDYEDSEELDKIINETFRVKFKDGTEKDISAFDDDGWNTLVSYDDFGMAEKAENSMFPHWKYPVNVDDIVSVTLCGQTFEFD